MPNLIQIKRSTTTAVATGLANGEFAYTANGDVLFIGSNGGIVAIGGARNPGTLTANQALVANATSGIDKIIVANLVPTGIFANGAAGTGGQVLASNSTGGIYWSTPTAGVAGSDTQIQFNDGGALGGDAGLTYNKTTDTVTVAGSVLSGATVNAAAHTVGSAVVANSTGVYTTGTVNAVTLSVGSWVVANNGGVYTSGGVNAAVLSVGSTFFANTTRVVIGTTTGLQANGGIGTAGQVLTSNATTVYWSTPTTGTVTSIATANGLSGGPITSTGTIGVTSGSSLTVNSTGIHVNTANLSIATSQLTGDVALGTNTSGNYVATITAGNGISGSSSTEGGTPTIAVVAGTDGGLVSNSTGVFVTAGSGLVTNSTGLHVGTGNGISVAADSVAVNGGSTLTVNSTGAHVNTNLSITSLSLSGDLVVAGNVTTTTVASIKVSDPLIYLAGNNNVADTLDIGFVGQYYDGAASRWTGLFRDHGTNNYRLFANTTQDLSGNNDIDTAAVGYTVATLYTYLNSGALVSNSAAVTITANSTVNVNITANSLTLSTPLAVSSGGLGLSSITAGAILVGNGSGTATVLSAATNGYVLQSNGTSVVYGTLDGGTF